MVIDSSRGRRELDESWTRTPFRQLQIFEILSRQSVLASFASCAEGCLQASLVSTVVRSVLYWTNSSLLMTMTTENAWLPVSS